MNRFFRSLYALDALALFASPFLSWKTVVVLGVSVPLPGLLWHGVWISLVALVVLVTAASVRSRWGPLLLATLSSAGLTERALHAVAGEGDRVLLQMQLKLTGVNEALSTLGLAPVDFYHRTEGVAPGQGLRLAVASTAMLAAIWCADVAWQLRSGRGWRSLVWRHDGCPACHARLRSGARFCYGCGGSLDSRASCPECRAAVEPGDRFCAGCSSPLRSRPDISRRAQDDDTTPAPSLHP